jgi:tetratricopeptide (TPR) repeat protein
VAELPVPEGMTQLTAAVSSYETATPYAAIGILLRQVLGIGAHEAPDASAIRLRDAVRTRAADLEPWMPLLGVALDLEIPSTRQVDDLEERFRRGRIEEVTIALLAALLVGPVLLVLEDAHLMDEASGALLHRFETEVHRQPWCVIVTRRHIPVGYVPGLEGELDTRIALAGVPPERALELLESAAGTSRPSRHTLEAMAERAAGNPLFLASLAANVHAAEGEDDLPGSVEALLLVDIDRLTLADRTLLRLAAVLGARFEADILTRLHADTDAGPPLAADEIAARLNEFVRVSDDGVLEFRHAMVRDVAYAGLPFRQRRSMHERVAMTLESLGDRAAGPDLLSLHFHAAGLHEKAWSSSLQAAVEARAKYAYAQAATFFARALDSAAHLPEVAAADRSAASVSLGECLDMAGDATGALLALRRARRDLRDDVVVTADVMHKEARITLRLGRYRATLAQLTRAMRALDGVVGKPADAVRARIANRYGFCLHLQNRGDEAVRWGHASVRYAEASADLELLADAYNALHLSYAASTMPEERPYGQLALGLYEQLGDLSGQAHTLNNLAIDTYNGGDWDGAIEAFARAAASFHRLGDDANEANALYNRAEVLVAQGRHGAALPVVTAALHLARRVDDEELVGLALREQARAASGTGDAVRGRALFAEARAVLAGLDLASEVVLLDAARAEGLAADGDVAEALALLDRAIAVAEAKASETLARLHRIRAQAFVRQGNPERAAAAAREGLTHTMGAHGGYEPALLRFALAEATDDDALRAESRRALAALGVVA